MWGGSGGVVVARGGAGTKGGPGGEQDPYKKKNRGDR